MLIHHCDLSGNNSFSLRSTAAQVWVVRSYSDLLDARDAIAEQPFWVLGGGSNVILAPQISKPVLHMQIQGIELIDETDDQVVIAVGAGHNWHDLVCWAVAQGYAGIENLALIPGTVGAAPIQNIGAYGVELASVLVGVDVLPMGAANESDNSSENSVAANNISANESEFWPVDSLKLGYRDSIFKHELSGKAVIHRVVLTLQKTTIAKEFSYPALAQALTDVTTNKTQQQVSIQQVFDAVVAIRQEKLPNPSQLPNAGSFFKNPVVSKGLYQTLQATYPDMPCYFYSDEQVKLPAAWLLDTAGFKGHREGPVGFHTKQALVMVNYGDAQVINITQLAELAANKIQTMFQIELEIEPSYIL